MSLHPSDEIENVFRLARIYRPEQLRRKALDFMRAFLVQHQALSVAASHELRGCFDCGCDDCVQAAATGMASLCEIEADIRQIFTAQDLLFAVNPDFEVPHGEPFDKAEEILRERMLDAVAGDDTDRARASFERLLSHPNDSDPHETP